uniref:uncharacterized protein LOC114604423 n=1 Tax=Podarcis muralis TaxID=64176 RepID=UPI0010A03D22|nr:uncharacterized protein LOC114604423 [Podarcis muralis]
MRNQVIPWLLWALTSQMATGWKGNTFLNMTTAVARSLNRSECWVCVHVPMHLGQGIPITGVPFPMNATSFQRLLIAGPPWLNETYRVPQHHIWRLDRVIEGGPCIHRSVAPVDSAFWKAKYPTDLWKDYWWQPDIPDEIFVGNHSGCTYIYNMTLPRWTKDTWPPTFPLATPGWREGWFWLCDHTAYKTLPRNWYGTCSLGTLTPGLTIHDTFPGEVRPRYRRSGNPFAENPLVVRGTAFQSALRVVFPRYGVFDLERALVNVSASLDIFAASTADALTTLQQEVAQMAQIANLTAEALLALQIEIRQTATITLQNRMALDYLLASQGGVCTLLNTSCCVYINQDQRVVTNIEQIRKLATIYNHSDRVESNVDRIKKQADLYRKISLAGGELPSMWNWFTSWLPGWGWLKEILLVILFLFLTLLLLSCLLPCLIQLVRRMVSRSVEAATRTHVLALYDIKLMDPSTENDEPEPVSIFMMERGE